MERKTNQSGSIKTFFIVGFILTCVLITSAVYVKNHGEDVRRAQTDSTSQNQTKPTESDSDKTTDEPVESNEPVTSQMTTENDDDAVTETTEAADLSKTGPESIVFEMFVLFVVTVFATSLFTSKSKKQKPLFDL